MRFQRTEDGVDRGSGIRDKAKQILDLVSDEELLKAEQDRARQNRLVVVGLSNCLY